MEQDSSLHHPRDDVIRSRRVTEHACIWTNKIAGSTARRVEESSMLTTGAVGETAASRMWKKMRSHYGRSPWNFHFNPICGWHQHGEATSVCQWLTSLWSGGYDSMPARQLNPQHPAPQQQFNSHINNTSRMKKNLEHLSPDRMKKGMEELRPDWQIDQSIQSRAQFSNKARVEAVTVAGVITITSPKCFQALAQAFDQAGYSLSTA